MDKLNTSIQVDKTNEKILARAKQSKQNEYAREVIDHCNMTAK